MSLQTVAYSFICQDTIRLKKTPTVSSFQQYKLEHEQNAHNKLI